MSGMLYRRRPGGNRRAHNLRDEFDVGSSCVLALELTSEQKPFVFRTVSQSPRSYLVPVHPESVLHVDVGCRDEGMDTRVPTSDSDSIAASMSSLLVRASDATTHSTARSMARMPSRSPGDEIAKPASMMSTPSRSSWRAISIFLRVQRDTMLGDCSPSLECRVETDGRCPFV